MGGPEIERLIALLGRLPGFGPRSARRAALRMLLAPESRMLPLADALGRVTHRAAAVVASGGATVPTGRIEVGGAADLCLFDPAARWTVEAAALRSQGKNTPFAGYEMRGRVRLALVGGSVVFDRS